MTRWQFELRVATPDAQLLEYGSTYPEDYMDRSLLENLLYRLVDAAVAEIKAREEYLN